MSTLISATFAAALLHLGIAAMAATPPGNSREKPENSRPRAREIGIEIGVLSPGKQNAITDVAGVEVGHRTLHEGRDVHTGVTAVLPHGGNVFQQKVPAAIVVGNGFGKLVGVTQVQELGLIETPIVLTNTLSIFTAADAVIAHTLSAKGNEAVRSVNPVVGETNDGYLNDIRARRIGREDVLAAIGAARGGAVEEGCVGAGSGTLCLGFKGGIGTSSRKLAKSHGGYTVGVLVQSNFSGVLSVAGAPVGKDWDRHFMKQKPARSIESKPGGDASAPKDEGSCMIVLATDAPLDARQLTRLGRRALLGLAAIGSPMTHGSGDYVIAFSAAPEVRVSHEPGSAPAGVAGRPVVRDEALSGLFQAAREATEEAILNSMLRATTVRGHRGTSRAISIDRLLETCRRHRVLREAKP
jgi:D-aminopeptidase